MTDDMIWSAVWELGFAPPAFRVEEDSDNSRLRFMDSRPPLLRAARLYPYERMMAETREPITIADFVVPCVAAVDESGVIWKNGFDRVGPARLELLKLSHRNELEALLKGDADGEGLRREASCLTKEAAPALQAAPTVAAWVADPEGAAASVLEEMRRFECRQYRFPAHGPEYSIRASNNGLVLAVGQEDGGTSIALTGVVLFLPGFVRRWPVPREAAGPILTGIADLPESHPDTDS